MNVTELAKLLNAKIVTAGKNQDMEITCGYACDLLSWVLAHGRKGMKHVGVNVAADPIFTAAYTGVNGGMVICCADDPAMHSSQNEQDSRYYARAAHIPMLEPADSQECKDFAALAFQLSEELDTPIFIRLTTRIAHARSAVTLGERSDRTPKPYRKDAMKYVMMPGMWEHLQKLDNRRV